MSRFFFMWLFLLNVSSFSAENWPVFRGHHQDGSSDAVNIPSEWSEIQNIKWKTAIHDLGWSTPVVWGKQIWLTTATKDGKQFFAVGIDLETGKIVYDLKIFEESNPPKINELNSYATPTCVVEPGRVYVHFGTFGTACLNSQTGKKIWERRDLNCEHLQGPASSPILYQNLIILHLEGTDVQYVVALDKSTGKTIWKTERPPEHYQVDPLFRKAYSTPIVINVNKKDQLISPGAQVGQAFDPLTGKEIWRLVYGYDSAVSVPIFCDNTLIISSGLGYIKGKQYIELYGVKPDGQGDITKTHILWKINEHVPGISSPTGHDGLVYMVSDLGTATCFEAKTGKIVWQKKIGRQFHASPLYADGKVYFLGRKGKTTIVQAGRTFKILAENQLDGEVNASPAIVGKSIIIRTNSHLYRIEK